MPGYALNTPTANAERQPVSATLIGQHLIVRFVFICLCRLCVFCCCVFLLPLVAVVVVETLRCSTPYWQTTKVSSTTVIVPTAVDALAKFESFASWHSDRACVGARALCWCVEYTTGCGATWVGSCCCDLLTYIQSSWLQVVNTAASTSTVFATLAIIWYHDTSNQQG